ncbi:MAG: hypothetical protein GYA62_13415 [Bacteroidales bacterium]|nr:hypothetical protein [Bacteroidales bacterium]
MVYCDINDIKILTNFIDFNENTIPSATQVNNWIYIISSEITIASKKNKIDINNLNDDQKNILKKYCSEGVAGMVLNVLLNNNQTEGTQANFYKIEYEKFLKNIKSFLIEDSFSPTGSGIDNEIEEKDDFVF